MESFDVRALPTAGASVNLEASPFCLSRTSIDSKITSLELRAPATRLLSTRAASSFAPLRGTRPRRWRGSIASAFPRPCVSGVSSDLNLCARADNDMDTLAIDSPSSLSRLRQVPNRFSSFLDAPGSYAYLSSPPACVRTLMPVIRTHDDDKSMCPSRPTLHYAVILGVIFPCSTRIPPYLRPNPRGSNAGHAYPPHLSIQWEIEGRS
ncbi:hypothetical protein B0H14DRAFT_3485845 [Mycena olivaceomarginata]|nr:hypothetical protein B0H14DRAFT_3485845 [Mycena olivaceomarginata]